MKSLVCPDCAGQLDGEGHCWLCGPRKHPVSGIDLAAAINPETAAIMKAMKEQLLIVFLKRLGGKVTIPVHELDDTGRDNLAMRFDPATREFHFENLRSPS